MARPKKNLPPVKERKFTIRMTDAMYEALEAEVIRGVLRIRRAVIWTDLGLWKNC